MGPAEAALRVLREDPGTELHWTVIWDRALRAGAIEPGPDARPAFLRALADAERQGLIQKASKGTYRLPPDAGIHPSGG